MINQSMFDAPYYEYGTWSMVWVGPAILTVLLLLKSIGPHVLGLKEFRIPSLLMLLSHSYQFFTFFFWIRMGAKFLFPVPNTVIHDLWAIESICWSREWGEWERKGSFWGSYSFIHTLKDPEGTDIVQAEQVGRESNKGSTQPFYSFQLNQFIWIFM